MNKIIIGLLVAVVVVVGAIFVLNKEAAVPAQTFTGEVFALECEPDVNFSFRYADNDLAILQLTANETKYELNQVRAGSGAKYENAAGTMMFWEHQGEVDLEIEDASYTGCIIAGDEVVQEASAETQIDDLIVVEDPINGADIISPVELRGGARGYWFFEGSAPVEVINGDGEVIGEGYVTADGDWMTEEFVPFAGEVTYQQTATASNDAATVVLKRANPSALSENDASIEIAVLLVD